MKRIYPALLICALSLSLTSCELDNYDGPNAQIYGSVIDIETGKLIEQDVENGSKIIYKELGWSNPEEQKMIFMVNGEYRNNLMFAANYDIYFNESNFVRPETLSNYKIKAGKNRLDFKVQPYIRVTDVTITRGEGKVAAKFRIAATVSDNVKEIGLFGHVDRIAGNQFALAKTTKAIGTPVTSATEYTLELSTEKFTKGESYYFRAGALISGANVKYNYAPAVRIKL